MPHNKALQRTPTSVGWPTNRSVRVAELGRYVAWLSNEIPHWSAEADKSDKPMSPGRIA